MSRKAPEIDPKPAETITFGGFVFLTKSRELRTAEGKAVDLRSQSAEVLSALAARPGEIVSKDALMQAVWPDTFVTDDSLTQCIADIRRALGDDEHVIVETFPKRGYRLNADPSDAADPNAAAGRNEPDTISRNAASFLPRSFSSRQRSAHTTARNMASRSRSFERHAQDCGPSLRRHECRCGQGISQRCRCRGDHHRAGAEQDYAVIARNSSFKYRDKPTDARQIGDELGVDYLLEGSQQKIGDRLKVTAQLLNAHDGSNVWANTYNREIGDLFVVQEEIIRTLAVGSGKGSSNPCQRAMPPGLARLIIT